MTNKFYSEFDFERVLESSRQEDYRTPFQIDRDRLIHSSEFRRLQGKTQVFIPGDNDYYRTRLTHSIEVAQIGRTVARAKHAIELNVSEECSIAADGVVKNQSLVGRGCNQTMVYRG